VIEERTNRCTEAPSCGELREREVWIGDSRPVRIVVPACVVFVGERGQLIEFADDGFVRALVSLTHHRVDDLEGTKLDVIPRVQDHPMRRLDELLPGP
jgi:hypothetical protein